MIWRFLCIIGLTLSLSGCLQGTFVTIIDDNGDYQNLARVKTNALSFAAIAEDLKRRGIPYKQQILPDGKIQGEWHPRFGADEFTCKGIFLKECQMNVIFPLNIPDMMSQVMIMDAKKRGNPDEMLTISYVVILPETARIKSTNAHSQYVDEDGLNLEWSFTPDPGDVLQFNFKAGI